MFAFFWLSLFLGTRIVGAASFDTAASADAFVATGPAGNLSNANFGGAGALAVAASGLPQGEFQSVLRFDLHDAANAFDLKFGAGQWSIQSVTLQLSASPANNTIFNPAAQGALAISWLQNDAWQEGTGTPTAPQTAGITFNSLTRVVMGPEDENLGTFNFTGATGATSFALSLAPGLTGDVAAGQNVSLRLFAADTHLSGVFNSRDFGVAAKRPVLIVAAVPEPTTATLVVVAGLLAFTWIRVRRKD